MEDLRADTTDTGPALAEEDICELRKYIVGMMRSEMELMASIKQNEEGVAAANVRITHVKELIVQEEARYKTLEESLAGDANELKLLEGRQREVEEKHRQLVEAVTKRESEVHALRVRFHQQRSAMIRVRHQIVKVNKRLEELSAQDTKLDEERRSVTAALGDIVEPTDLKTEHHKLLAKSRHVKQYITQLEDETKQLVEQRAKLEAKVLKYRLESHGLRESLFRNEEEGKQLFSRLREDTLRVVRENGKTKDKLKAKQKKFRLKTKNEMRSLKRRISFISSEVERGQMTNEDTLSDIHNLGRKRMELEQSLHSRNEHVIDLEKAVAGVSTLIASNSRKEGEFSTSRLQDELATRQKDVQAAQKKLHEKENLLNILEADHDQLNTSLQNMDPLTETAQQIAENLDRDIACLMKTIEEREVQTSSLRESLNNTQAKCKKLRIELKSHQSKFKRLDKVQAKLRRQRSTLLKQQKGLAGELREAENLSWMLGEGIQHGTECARQLDDAKATNDESQQQMAFELRRQELDYQLQCAGEEAKFQAEIAAWNEKIKSLEGKLRAL